MTINTKEQLKSHIHKIHNFIRNSGAGYGLDALKIFNFFYGLKVLEPVWDEYDLKSAKFSKLVDMANKADTPEKELRIHDELFGNSYNENDKKYRQGSLYELNDNKELRKMLVSKINDALKTNFYKQIILEINKIPTVNNKQKTDIIGNKFDVDIKGKTYEYFIGRDKQAISDLGAYFSDRHFTNFAINIVNPELIDGKVPMYIDPFGGSGGFTISFVNYINLKYPKLNWDINDNIDSINHYDMSEVVVKSCALEIFALTGKIPDIKEAFQIGNSFKADFCGFKYKYIFSNPPFGGSVAIDTNSESHKLINELKNRFYSKVEGDKDKDKDIYKWSEDWPELQYKKLKDKLDFEIIEIKEQQVNWDTCGRRLREYCIDYDERIDKKYRKEGSKDYKELIKTFQIRNKCNDKEACSLIMFMELLDKDGIATIIIKEGVLFDSKYSSIRKCLVDNFNITHIISIPQDAFENTSTKTSIIIFKNNGKTEKIRFSELVVEKESDDIYEIITNINDDETYLELTAHIDQIKKVSDEVKIYATYEEISKSSLKSVSKSHKVVWNYSLNYKDYLKDTTFCPEGYKLVKMKDLFEYMPKSKRQASFATDKGQYKFYTSSDKIKKCTECDIKSDKSLLIFGTGGKGSLFIDKEFSCSADNFICSLKNNISLEHIYYIYQYIKSNWEYFMYKMFNGSTLGHINKTRLNEYQIPIPNDITLLKPQLSKLFKNYFKISYLTEQIPQKEKVICDLINELILNGEEEEYKFVKMKELFEYMPKSKRQASFATDKGQYRFYTSSDKIKKCTECDFKSDKPLLIFGTGGNGSLFIDKEFSCSADNFVCSLKNDIPIEYLNVIYQYIKSNWEDYKYRMFNGSTLGHINKTRLDGYKLPIPNDIIKFKFQLTKYKLQEKFDEVDKMKEELEETKNTYQEDIKKFMEPFNQETINDDNTSKKSLILEKKILKTRKQIEPESESKSESETESELESETESEFETETELILEKLDIKKTDLIQLKLLNDSYTHWYHPLIEKIFTKNSKNQWNKGKNQLYDIYKDEIKKIKLSKELKQKKNKSTKSKIIVDVLESETKNKYIKKNNK
jgi:type I restriction-modification system DNA methylase subunit